MVFSSKCKNSNKCNIQIKIKDINIERVTYTKFLGVLLDENLSWCEHIRSIENKISRNIGILYKCNKILDSVHLLYLYNSLVLPYLNYCAVIWGNNKKCRLTTLTCLQKKAIRCIAKVGFKDHTSPLFKKYHMLKLSDIICMNTGVLMFRIMRSKVLPNLNLFMPVNAIHYYNTRNTASIFITQCRTNYRKHSLKYTGAKLWNKLPLTLKNCNCINSFKHNFKKLLCQRY